MLEFTTDRGPGREPDANLQDGAEPASPGSDAGLAAQAAGLTYVSDEQPGISRRAGGEAFEYVKPDGQAVADSATLGRIRALGIPPAWTEVWICAKPNGHLQATGRDAKGRKQYRYHEAFREVRETSNFEHLLQFAQALPAVRARIAQDMSLPGLPRKKVIATVVHLLETTLIRIGDDGNDKANQSDRLGTLRHPPVKVERPPLRFQFQGKSGKTLHLQVHDRRVSRVIKACQELPGQELFQYLDEAGDVRHVTSTDVNGYLREMTGRDITARDFRTWAGTVQAALALHALEPFESQAHARKNVRAAIERVAGRLGNTPAVCRQCYIHPEVLAAYAAGELLLKFREDDARQSLRPEEAAVLALVRARLSRTVSQVLRESIAVARQARREKRGWCVQRRAAPGAMAAVHSR